MFKKIQKLKFKIKPVCAHCDLMCGVYDPQQALIEARSVQAIMQKYHASDDQDYRTRCIIIKEQRAELVKQHLWVLWTDYFQPEHLELHPDLHNLFWRATKQAGQCKKTVKLDDAQKLIDLIEEISTVFAKTKA